MKNPRLVQLAAFFRREPVLLGAYLLLTLLASLQNYFLGLKSFGGSPAIYTEYNNYVIFRQSFFHLLANRNLYAGYPAEQWDLFKYSPTFALAMAALAYLPDWLGLLLWNALNSLVPFFALKALPGLSVSQKNSLRWFVLIELLTSLQNAQSNGLILGLMVGSLVCLERKKAGWATLCLLLGAFIKPFAAAGFLLFVFYPKKGLAALSALGWATALALLPALAVGPTALLAQYQNWGTLLRADHAESAGLSVMGWLNTWLGVFPPKTAVVGAGAVVLTLPLVRWRAYQHPLFRLWLLASVLIWVVIFNHKAESPTFILAMGGVGLWFFSGEKTRFDTLLVVLAFVFTSLSPTDVFPPALRASLVEPFVLKAAFPIFIWLKISYDLLVGPFGGAPHASETA